MLEAIFNPWPWYVSGPLIALVMGLLIFSGRTFGASANFRTLCLMAGADERDRPSSQWRDQRWNLMVMLGAALGAAFSMAFLHGGAAVPISAESVASLQALGVEDAGQAFQPGILFGPQAWRQPLSLLVLATAGLLVGLGTRLAGGCTSGHAISGLSNLQWVSLTAVVGFFVGGLVMTHYLLPTVLSLLTETSSGAESLLR